MGSFCPRCAASLAVVNQAGTSAVSSAFGSSMAQQVLRSPASLHAQQDSLLLLLVLCCMASPLQAGGTLFTL